MAKFRKKPVVIEATQYCIKGPLAVGVCYCGEVGRGYEVPHVHTIHDEQHVVVADGDWIISEPDGQHFYPCKPDIFDATYEPALIGSRNGPAGS